MCKQLLTLYLVVNILCLVACGKEPNKESKPKNHHKTEVVEKKPSLQDLQLKALIKSHDVAVVFSEDSLGKRRWTFDMQMFLARNKNKRVIIQGTLVDLFFDGTTPTATFKKILNPYFSPIDVNFRVKLSKENFNSLYSTAPKATEFPLFTTSNYLIVATLEGMTKETSKVIHIDNGSTLGQSTLPSYVINGVALEVMPVQENAPSPLSQHESVH